MPYLIKAPLWFALLTAYAYYTWRVGQHLSISHMILWLFAAMLVYSMVWDTPQIIEYLWRMLPDRCQIPGCERKGRRWWENEEDGKYVCDYCSVRYFLMKQGAI